MFFNTTNVAPEALPKRHWASLGRSLAPPTQGPQYKPNDLSENSSETPKELLRDPQGRAGTPPTAPGAPHWPQGIPTVRQRPPSEPQHMTGDMFTSPIIRATT